MTTCQAMPRTYRDGACTLGVSARTPSHRSASNTGSCGAGPVGTARRTPPTEVSPMATLQDIETWRGRQLVDRDGDKIGKIEDVYLDRQSGEPEWVAVKTGLFGSNVSFVPISDASTSGDDLAVAYTKDQVKDAPSVDADGELSPEEERRLYQHYGRSDYDEWTTDSEDRTEGTLGRDDRMSFDRERSGGTDIGRGDAESRGDLEARGGGGTGDSGRGGLGAGGGSAGAARGG